MDHFWVSSIPTVCSWAWRKILQLRRDSRASFLWKLGDGQSVSLWYDNWHPEGPWSLIFPNSLIATSGLTRQATVTNLLSPEGRVFRTLLESWQFALPVLSRNPDRFYWRESPDDAFSVASAWEAIRTKNIRVPWARFTWNNAIASRFQFNLWLIIKNRLPTQAFLLSIGRIDFELCAFCNHIPDSIDHLFFDCHVPATLAFF